MDRPSPDLVRLCVNTIRGLAIDAVQAAGCGHPGMPLGAAPLAFALWTRHLRHNPSNPKWLDRDRFVLSSGHGSMLLYALLHLTGYDLPLDEIKHFRQWGSKTPGHPENVLTPGVEMATGPLGQGLSAAVGMAIAERFLSATFNRPGHEIVGHRTFVICSDGDLMEGVTNEAASLAGHLKLGKLIVLYDDNDVTIDGSTDLTFTEDVPARFTALGWRVENLANGMHVDAVDEAIARAVANSDRPSMIVCKTIIGFGSPHKAGTAKAHGAALGEEEARLTKRALGIPEDEQFWVPQEALHYFRKALNLGQAAESEWRARLDRFAEAFPEDYSVFCDAMAGKLPADLADELPEFPDKVSTRVASGKTLNVLAKRLPTLIGGSADLADSNSTWLEGYEAFQSGTPSGRNICFGVREHTMMSSVNGMNLHGGVRAYGASFLIFSDYCRPSIRLSALMHCPSIFVFTHDSIGLGEDGPTHQPVEHLMALRAIPNLNVMRPADGNEAAACWLLGLQRTDGPSLIALTRQAVPAVSVSDPANHPCRKGGYILRESSAATPRIILVASGSEAHVAMGALKILEDEGIPTRVVSLMSWYLFEKQSEKYRTEVLPTHVPTVSVEAGTTLGWNRYAHAHVGLDRFGASAPGDVLMRELGFTPENVANHARNAIGKLQETKVDAQLYRTPTA